MKGNTMIGSASQAFGMAGNFAFCRRKEAQSQKQPLLMKGRSVATPMKGRPYQSQEG